LVERASRDGGRALNHVDIRPEIAGRMQSWTSFAIDFPNVQGIATYQTGGHRSLPPSNNIGAPAVGMPDDNGNDRA
jgi:hypothetical protein